MKTSQLLCTFTNMNDLDKVIHNITNVYTIMYNYIYVLQNKSNLDELFITYNVDISKKPLESVKDTIIIHRKKETNTLYTINSLNELVKEENNGVLDNNFNIDWNACRNSIILNKTNSLEKIPTKIHEIIDVSVIK